MVALPTSLRRTMIMLLVAMTMVVMLFYWNQTSMKPIAFVNSIFETPTKHKLPILTFSSPPEKTWTYKCSGEKCIREHYYSEGNNNNNNNNNEPRIPFMSCAMICGVPNIWPFPTGKTNLGSRSLTLTAKHIQLNINTKFADVEKLFNDAYKIFLNDLKSLERSAGASATSSDGSNEIVGMTHELNEKLDNKMANNGAADSGDDNDDDDDDGGNNLDKNDKKNCDIEKLVISVNVSDNPVTYLHLEMDESYVLTMKNEHGLASVHIKAKTFFGARHALASLQQLIWYDDEDELLRILNTAHIEDEPKFRYRGLMLDTSRHYFSVESIKRTLIGMAHSKLNRFHWHMTDSQSFPFQSKHYPELAKYGAYSTNEIYTVDDVREIAEFARVRGIQVIPEIDAPAHAGNGWDWGPKHGLGELSLCINQQPWSFYCGEPPCGQLNPKNNNTYLILQKLYEELLDLVGPTDFFHIGGDEVNLECWSQYFNDTDLKGLWCDFMLQAFNRLKIANKNIPPRMVGVWSSGLTSSSCLSRHNFVVQLWGGSTWQENYDLLMNGYNVIMSHVDAWYLDCGFGSWRSTGEGACSPYTTWQKVYKHRPWERMHVEPNKMKQILGGEACLWTEQVDENSLDSRLWPRTAAIAERLWTDPAEEHETEIVPKDVFNRMSVFRNRLVQFGMKAEPIFPKYCSQNQDECV